MKRISQAMLSGILLLIGGGCFNEEPKATAQDRANVDRLAKEGIGARPLSGVKAEKSPDNAGLVEP